MNDTVSPWAEAAAAVPVAFAQVREDPRIDAALVERAGTGVRVCMVASGGCTAAVLATMPNVAAVHLVDANPAQLALARQKLRLVETEPPANRLAQLGHGAQPNPQPPSLGRKGASETGADFAGRYEHCFVELQRQLGTHAAELDDVLRMTDPAEQARRVAPETPLGRRLDEALDSAMSLANLVRLFGEGATRNPVEPFSRHFARRIRHVLATLPAADNPFLWQMLRGRYPDGHPADWFTLPQQRLAAAITEQQAFMIDALRLRHAEFDVVHLSNILDWLSPAEATATLETAANALRPGGWVIIRQLNSTLDIPASGPMFAWDVDWANDWHRRDRSFFYRVLHVGRKRDNATHR